ncbi:MAG TPA: hypothetical protein VEQ40_06680, partial [Pyrinomonadaceae bacterium]|nr:hypothetical protein [Pyrinomonadaceae bacterium]
DVADFFIDLGDIADKVRKEVSHGARYDERDLHEVTSHNVFMQNGVGASGESGDAEGYSAASVSRVVIESELDEETDAFEPAVDLIRVTVEH